MAKRPLDAQATHQLEARPVHERHSALTSREEGAVRRVVPLAIDPPRLDCAEEGAREVAHRGDPEPALDERGGLYHDVAVGHQQIAFQQAREGRRHARMVGIGAVEEGVQRRRVYEGGQPPKAASRWLSCSRPAGAPSPAYVPTARSARSLRSLGVAPSASRSTASRTRSAIERPVAAESWRSLAA